MQDRFDHQGPSREAWHGLLRGRRMSRDPRPYAALSVLLGLSAAVALMPPGLTPVQAAPQPSATACPTATPGPSGSQPAQPTPTGTPGPTPADPTPARPKPADPTSASPASATASPTPTVPSRSPSVAAGAALLADLANGLGDFFDGRHGGETRPVVATPSASPTVGSPAAPGAGSTAAPSAAPSAGPSVRPSVAPSAGSPSPAAPSARPTATGSGGPSPTPSGTCVPVSPQPTRPGEVVPGRPLPRIAADAEQPLVAPVPSTLTGSKVTMVQLRFEGIVDLPTVNGSLRALKFTMDQAVTDDFVLRSPGLNGRTLRYVTDELEVRGDVAFYATRFVGRLLGIKITLTPELPFPDGLPVTSPVPISFTDVTMELAFVNSDTLAARPALKLTLP